MDDSAIKTSRLLLRGVQAHLAHAHVELGVQRETLGFVEVVYHPHNRLPMLNYVTPRPKTAWVTAECMQDGLARLRALDRLPRIQYIEGLFPPAFAKTVSSLGIHPVIEAPILIFDRQALPALPPKPRPLPGGSVEWVSPARGLDFWQQVHLSPAQQNAGYDVLTLGVEPITVGDDAAAEAAIQHADVLVCQHDTLVGIARLSIHTSTRSAHVVALAIRRGGRTRPILKRLFDAALRAALAHDVTLVFAPGTTDQARSVSRTLGFIDMGRMVCYAASVGNDAVHDGNEGHAHDDLVQPVFTAHR